MPIHPLLQAARQAHATNPTPLRREADVILEFTPAQWAQVPAHVKRGLAVVKRWERFDGNVIRISLGAEHVDWFWGQVGE